MELTAIAQWLNTAFAGYDYAILQALHNLAGTSGGVFTPLCRAITLLGEKGILFLVLGIVLMLFPKTRKMGICMFGAVCCGALITNFWLKDFVARPRPLTVEPFRTWWQAAGAYAESEYSFPSGHVTAAMARRDRARAHGQKARALLGVSVCAGDGASRATTSWRTTRPTCSAR